MSGALLRIFLLFFAVVPALAAPPTSAPAERTSAPAAPTSDVSAAWPPLPSETRAVLLLTGGDFGYAKPKGCNGRAGGAQYRPAFDRWLAQRAPNVERIWLAAGDNGPFHNEQVAVSFDEMLALYARVGYRAATIGDAELRTPGPATLAREAAATGAGAATNAQRAATTGGAATNAQRAATTGGARPALVAANVVVHETGRAALPASIVLETRAGRWLVVGAAPHRPSQVFGAPDVGTIVTVPAAPAVRAELERRRGEYDHVVLVSSLDYRDLEQLVATVPGIDVVASSAGTYFEPAPRAVGATQLFWLGAEGLRLGRVALDDKGRVLEARVIPIRGDFPIDPLAP